MKKSCRFPGCSDHLLASRGVCRRHYQSMDAAIRSGVRIRAFDRLRPATWAVFERLGWCLAPAKRGPKSIVEKACRAKSAK